MTKIIKMADLHQSKIDIFFRIFTVLIGFVV